MGGSTLMAEVWDDSQSMPTQNLSSLLRKAASEHPNRPAVISLHESVRLDNGGNGDQKGSDQPRTWTYSRLHKESVRLAHCLSAKGVFPGSCIATILYNQIEWALFFWATAHLGCQFIGIDYRAIHHKDFARELLAKIPRSTIVVANRQLADAVNEALDPDGAQGTLRCVVDGSQVDGWTTLADVLQRHEEPDISRPMQFPRLPGDTAVIFFTSGTTGSTKACPHTAITLSSVARGLSKVHSIDENRTICQHLPGFHIFSVVYSVTAWLHGATLVYPSPTFDADSTIRAIASSRNVIVPCVPLMVHAMSKALGGANLAGSLESLIIGGSAVHPELLDVCMSLGPERIAAGYGSSECLVVASRNVPAKEALVDADEDVCLGGPISGVRIRICAPDSRQVLRRGEVGEVHLGGLPVFQGYLGQSSDSCYAEDGVPFHVSGDQGYLDEGGRLYVLGRYKDLIIRGGENISPSKIERHFSEKQKIKAQVVGVPDSAAGEAIVAVIQRTADTKVNYDEMRHRVAIDLGPLLAPSMVFDLHNDLGQEKFPATTSGKPQKAILRRWVKEHMENTMPSRRFAAGGTLESQLTEIWASVSGRSAASIPADVSVHTFADSMMVIQVLSILFDRFRKNVTARELAEHGSIRSQVELLEGRAEVLGATDGLQPAAAPPLTWRELPENEARIPELQQASRESLAAKDLHWNQVEDVFPKPDIIGPMAKGARANSWNHRHSMIVRNCKEDHVFASLKTWLEKHPLMRSMTTSDEAGEVFLVLPAQDVWLRHQLFKENSIERAEDLLTYRFNEHGWDCASPPGPFLKVSMLPIRHTSDFGLIFHWHHAIFDGVIIRQWYRELRQLLASQKPSTTFHSFQRYAAAVHRRSQNHAAEKAIDYHVNSLRGIAAANVALWPPQRAPLWLKGNDDGWRYPDGRLGEPDARVPLDGSHAIGTMGMEYSIPTPDILQLRERFEIPPPIVAKGACVLLNLHLTGGDEAVLVTNESGRSWPFVNASPGDVTDPNDDNGDDINPLSIDGPTVTLSVSRNRLLGDETVVQFLDRLRREQRSIEQHSHASVDAVLKRLETPAEDSTLADAKADGSVVRSILNRQVFDWLPDVNSAQAAAPGSDESHAQNTAADGHGGADSSSMQPSIEMLEVLSRTDLGFVWYPSLQEKQVLKLNTTWDDAQLRASEVSEAMKQFLCAARWLSQPKNWQRPARECHFEIDGVEIKDVGPAKCYRR